MFNEYHVDVHLKKTVSMKVKARSQEEAERVAEQHVFLKSWPGCYEREWNETIDETRPTESEKLRELPEDTREQELLDVIYAGDRNSREAIFCYENHVSLMNFDQWIHLQSIMGITISFAEFLDINEWLEGDALDCTEDDEAMLLRKLLRIRAN